jgi:hypothetical protein
MFRVLPILCSGSFIEPGSLLWAYVFIEKSKIDVFDIVNNTKRKRKHIKNFYYIYRKKYLSIVANTWYAVAQLVEVELEGRGFDSPWCHWIFPLT